MTQSKYCPDPTGKGKKVVHRKDPTPLFPSRLEVNQVIQGTGNCFLLSAINSILALEGGEDLIRRHMVEKDDKVHVLLYDDNYKPQWIVIDKSLPTSGFVSNGANWVKYLEKAYTAFHSGDYTESLSHGKTSHALQTFLGRPSSNLGFPYQSHTKLADLYKKSIAGGNGKDIYTLIFLLRPTPGMKQNLIEHVFDGDEASLNDWWKWVKSHKKDWEKLLTHNPLTMEKFLAHWDKMQFNQKEQCPKEAIQKIMDWIQRNKILPSEANYSYEEERLFDEIKDAIQSKQPLTTDSKDSPSRGIVPGHSYAIIGVRENPETNKKFVVLRNPFPEERSFFSHFLLSGGRHATEKIDPKTGETRLSINTTKSSTFVMELRDFTQTFQYLDKGNALNEVLEPEEDSVLSASKK